MTKTEFKSLMHCMFEEIKQVHEQGSKEYARNDNDVFANFNRISQELHIPREHVLWVYFYKHKDGVASYLEGHRSQREDVRGRIKDMITYLILLRGMIEENEKHGTGPCEPDTGTNKLVDSGAYYTEQAIAQAGGDHVTDPNDPDAAIGCC